MSTNLRLADIFVGKIDGKDEFSSNGALDLRRFDSFVLTPQVNIARFRTRQSQFVLGMRGTGKTSLLRYFGSEEEENGCFVKYLLFKSDITEAKRVEISKNVSYELVSGASFEVSQDFKESWRWFVFYQIAKILQEQSAESSAVGEVLELTGISKSWFSRVLGYFPKLNSGKIKIETSVGAVKAVLDADLQAGENTVSLESLNRSIQDLLLKIKIDKRLYLFFDELEVFYQNDEQYRRDLRLVRDLIFTIKSLNDYFQSRGVSIYLIAAVRSEVLYALGGEGQEVERLVEDFSEKFVWHVGRRDSSHPLIDVIRMKILTSERRQKLPDRGDAIERYFPPQINGMSSVAYLLDFSFYKPRDLIVRMLVAQQTYPTEAQFSQSVIEKTASEYARKLWLEVKYELSAIYRNEEIAVIESLFNAKTAFFRLDEFSSRLNDYALVSEAAQSLQRRRGARQILDDLFRLGAVGNEWTERSRGRVNRWIFRGELSLLHERQMVLNRALWNYFAVRR